ncbi:MAG TPA: L,D-transpeptidase [Clostridiales bacterium]|nr:L,D-transpeptidase [Clostridiales bacterium]
METKSLTALFIIFAAVFLICNLTIKRAYEIRITTLGYDRRQIGEDDQLELKTASPEGINGKLSFKDEMGKKNVSHKRDNIYLLVDILTNRLTVYMDNRPVKSYPVVLGRDTMKGDKEVKGDYRTPRGEFYICQKAVISGREEIGTRWIRLSYPNIQDATRGLKAGIISKSQHDSIVKAIREGGIPPQRTPLGGGIGIHGGAQVKDSTQGCISLYDKDVEELYELVDIGTRVIIID